MSKLSDAYRAAAAAWTVAAQLADLGEPTTAAILHARLASQAAASGNIRIALANAHKAEAMRDRAA